MGDYTAKGKALMDKADKKLSSWGMFGNKYEDAAEFVEKACNQFKLGKACESPAFLRFCTVLRFLLTSVWERQRRYPRTETCRAQSDEPDVPVPEQCFPPYCSRQKRCNTSARHLTVSACA